jgi:short-subunit dehydrogenase
MTKTLLVCGYGSGISDAVARKFGADGFSVALVARSEDKLTAAAKTLTDAGVKAQGFVCDLSDTKAVAGLVEKVRAALGPITVIHWNAYAGTAGDLTTASVAEIHASLDVGVTSLIVATQAALPDLRAQKGAVLVTGGGLSTYDEKVDAMAVSWNAMGLALAKAAQHKAAGLLHAKLAPEGVYVGEVVVMGSVKGTAFDQGGSTLEASSIADAFHALYTKRDVATRNIS